MITAYPAITDEINSILSHDSHLFLPCPSHEIMYADVTQSVLKSLDLSSDNHILTHAKMFRIVKGMLRRSWSLRSWFALIDIRVMLSASNVYSNKSEMGMSVWSEDTVVYIETDLCGAMRTLPNLFSDL